jgi:hypothetical protein
MLEHLKGFAHRRNLDGTRDSICRRCAVAIMSSGALAEVTAAEKHHVCDEELLERRANLLGAPNSRWKAQQTKDSGGKRKLKRP